MVSKVDLSPLRDPADSPTRRVGFGILRATLLFGTASVMMALFLAPIADHKARQYALQRPMIGNIDAVTTGSVRPQPRGNAYIVRRSVLTPNTEIICLPGADQSAGDC